MIHPVIYALWVQRKLGTQFITNIHLKYKILQSSPISLFSYWELRGHMDMIWRHRDQDADDGNLDRRWHRHHPPAWVYNFDFFSVWDGGVWGKKVKEKSRKVKDLVRAMCIFFQNQKTTEIRPFFCIFSHNSAFRGTNYPNNNYPKTLTIFRVIWYIVWIILYYQKWAWRKEGFYKFIHPCPPVMTDVMLQTVTSFLSQLSETGPGTAGDRYQHFTAVLSTAADTEFSLFSSAVSSSLIFLQPSQRGWENLVTR